MKKQTATGAHPLYHCSRHDAEAVTLTLLLMNLKSSTIKLNAFRKAA